MCAEYDRDLEFLRISRLLETVRPGAVLPRNLYGAWIANPKRTVEIISPYASGSREGFITLKRDLCGRRSDSSVYHAARHAVNLRIAKLTDLTKRRAGFRRSERVSACLASSESHHRKQRQEARQAYLWSTADEFLSAARERSDLWHAANKRPRSQKHPFIEYDAAVVELLRKIIVAEDKTRSRRRNLLISAGKGHHPNDETIREVLQIGIDLINVDDITYYLAHASFFGALNACDIYTEFSEIRGALEVLAYLGRVNLGVADPSRLHASAFLDFMQRYERWVSGSGKIHDLDCEVVSSVTAEFGLAEHFRALEYLCRARLQPELNGAEPITPHRRYWAMI